MRNVFWVIVVLAAGCASQNAAENRKGLDAGYKALGQHDYASAMDRADEFLRNNPNGGPGTAEALYLQGRVYEQRATQADAAGQSTQARGDLNTARATYEHALTLNPSPKLAALLHAGIANCAYFQDDYATAMREWAQSYDGLEQPDAKAWVLYRVGLCQQRLGRFEQADHNFASVRQQFPQSEAAARAGQRQGARAFFVQVGAFTDPANAGRTADSLRAQGFPAQIGIEPTGRRAVRVGPVATYLEAKTYRARLLSAFPGAAIEP